MSMLTPDWLATLAARAADPHFADARAALGVQVARYRTTLPAIPERQAGYYHDFFCPQHAVQLHFDPRQPHAHSCPVDGAIFRGEPFDSAWRWLVNDRLSDATLKLALHAALGTTDEQGDTEQDDADRAQARAILLGYAARYRTMSPPPIPHPTHPGVVTWSGLDESVWIIRLTWAVALLGEALMPDDARTLREDLLRPAADHLRRERWPEIHNVTNWNNAALVTLALALGDESLLGEALNEPLGVAAQLAGGVYDDGFWWEGSLSYHYYTLAALVWTARALRASGRAFAGADTLRRMFRAPLTLAFPDLGLPAIHDCWYQIGLLDEVGHGIPDAAGFYEVAHAWYDDPAFAWLLCQNYARHPRVALEALLDGVAEIPATSEPPFANHHARGSGLVVLRTDAPRDRQHYLLLKAGPDARAHGHPDQLSVQLFAQGARLAVDLGTPGYGIGLNDTWYRQTASHSTILLDGRSQPPADGRITRYEERDDFVLTEGVVAWESGPYAGVELRRLIVWREAYWIDCFSVVTPVPRQIDWVWLNCGALLAAPPADPAAAALGEGDGYRHFTAVARLRQDGAADLCWQHDSARLALALPPDDGARYIATTPANPATQTLSALVRRRVAANTTFLAVFAPAAIGAAPAIRSVRWDTDPSTRGLSVETTTGYEHWRFDGTSGGVTPRRC